MANYSGFRITLLAGDYPTKYDNFVTAAESVASEVETARGGFASLSAGLVGYTGMSANLPAAGNRITGLGDPIGGADAATKQWVETLALSASIPVTGADAGKTMTNNGTSLYWAAADFFLPAKTGKAGWSLDVNSGENGWVLKQKQDRLSAIAYDNRADLRGLSPSDGDLALVDGLGLFRYRATGDEGPDDDETAFACGAGWWVLDCPTLEVVDAYTLMAEDYQDQRMAAAEATLAANAVVLGKTFAVTSTQSAYTLAINSSTTFTVTVTGAKTGAAAIVTPPGSPTLNTITVYAYVSSANTVTVYIGNASASLTGGFGAGDWRIVVINK